MTNDVSDSRWVIFHDTIGGWIHLVRAYAPGHHWDIVKLDAELSDPAGNFLVYAAHRSRSDVRISIKTIGEHHVPVALHRDFDPIAFGSPTLFWGDVARSMWWIDSPWLGGRRPESWKAANNSEANADGFLAYPYGARIYEDEI